MPLLSMHSEIGDLTLREEAGRIVSLDWSWGGEQETTSLLEEARRQIRDYLAGARRQFDLPIEPSGSDFQRRVWRAMTAIPYGQTRTYGELAEILDSAPRAIGSACGRNPIPIIVPCHRVLARGSGLGGYSGHEGLATKRRLLDLEGIAYLEK